MANFYQKPSFPWILTLVMAGLNAVLLVFLWTGRGPKRMHPPHKGPHGPVRIETVLGFDDQQKQAFKELREAHFVRMDSLRGQMRAHRDQAFRQLKGGQPDSSLVQKELEKMGSITTQIEQEVFTHFLQVRTMCKPDQLSKFDNELLDELLKPKGGGPHGPPPPPGPQD